MDRAVCDGALGVQVDSQWMVILVGVQLVATAADKLHQWHRWTALSNLVEILIVPDQGPMRSSKIREAIGNGDLDSVKDWLPRQVYAKLQKSSTYRKKDVDTRFPIG